VLGTLLLGILWLGSLLLKTLYLYRPCLGGEAYFPSQGGLPCLPSWEVRLSLGRMEMMPPLSSLSSALMQRTADLGGLQALICLCQPHLVFLQEVFSVPFYTALPLPTVTSASPLPLSRLYSLGSVLSCPACVALNLGNCDQGRPSWS
jgi:hypothetical protein